MSSLFSKSLDSWDPQTYSRKKLYTMSVQNLVNANSLKQLVEIL